MKFFDAHFHIINYQFPVIENNGFMPDEYLIPDYLEALNNFKLNPSGGAIVSGSFQGYDQNYLINTLEGLNNPNYVGVTQIPSSITDEEILHLHSNGIRAVRFNVFRGGSENVSELDYLARRVYELVGWHTELYIDLSTHEALINQLTALPRVSIDHLGMSESGLKSLYHLVEKGVKVKATGFSRVDFDVAPVLNTINQIDPNALMFGSDLPSTRAPIPFNHKDIALVKALFSIDNQQNIFYQNAFDWYIGAHLRNA